MWLLWRRKFVDFELRPLLVLLIFLFRLPHGYFTVKYWTLTSTHTAFFAGQVEIWREIHALLFPTFDHFIKRHHSSFCFCNFHGLACFRGFVSLVSVVSFRSFRSFRWFRSFRFGGFARFVPLVSLVSVVSCHFVSVVSFRCFGFYYMPRNLPWLFETLARCLVSQNTNRTQLVINEIRHAKRLSLW